MSWRDGPRNGVRVASYAMMAALVMLDWATPAGIVVGLMLAVPIMLLSLLDRPRDVLIGAAVALTGYTLAAVLGEAGVAPRQVWLANRIFAVLGILVGTAASLEMQRHRSAAARALGAAVTARDLNRLLMSLLAHDLRAPLVAASHALEYVRRSAATGAPLDVGLLADTNRRLGRNLRMIESVLHMARLDLARAAGSDHPASAHPRLPLAQHLRREVSLFEEEASARGQSLRVSVDAVEELEVPVDSLVLTHALAILLDNAVQHGLPGRISIDAVVAARALSIRVADSGPGLGGRARSGMPSPGAGLGLELCRAMLARARGELVLEQDSPHGTVFRIVLPIGGTTKRAVSAGPLPRDTAPRVSSLR